MVAYSVQNYETSEKEADTIIAGKFTRINANMFNGINFGYCGRCFFNYPLR